MNKVITDVIPKKSPIKVTRELEVSPTRSPIKTLRKFSPVKTMDKTPKKDNEPNKENDSNQGSSVKLKLKRLGKLYSGKNLFFF